MASASATKTISERRNRLFQEIEQGEINPSSGADDVAQKVNRIAAVHSLERHQDTEKIFRERPKNRTMRHPDIRVRDAPHAVAHLSGGRWTVRERIEDCSRIAHLLCDRVINSEERVDRIDDQKIRDCENDDDIFEIVPAPPQKMAPSPRRLFVPMNDDFANPEREHEKNKKRNQERRRKFRELGDAEGESREPEIFPRR